MAKMPAPKPELSPEQEAALKARLRELRPGFLMEPGRKRGDEYEEILPPPIN